MGFRDWLTGKRGPVVVKDAVWLTHAARVRGVCGRLRGSERGVLLLAHFPATLERWRQDLTAAGVPHTLAGPRLEGRNAVRRLDEKPSQGALVATVEHLAAEPLAPPLDETLPELSLIVVERHFLRAEDERVVAFAEGLGRKCEVAFHTSLDDPLMSSRLPAWLGDTLRGMGMGEDDMIETKMVANRIKAAQADIARKAGGAAVRADSAAEWVRRNFPG
jgi:hypothetical protein